MPFPLEIRVSDKGDKGKSDININKLHKINHRKFVIIVGNPKSRNPESGIRNPESGIRNPESGIRNPESGIRNPESGIRNPESGIRNPESGIRNPESGIRNPESGIRNPKIKQNKVLQIHKSRVVHFSHAKVKRSIKNGFK